MAAQGMSIIAHRGPPQSTSVRPVPWLGGPLWYIAHAVLISTANTVSLILGGINCFINHQDSVLSPTEEHSSSAAEALVELQRGIHPGGSVPGG